MSVKLQTAPTKCVLIHLHLCVLSIIGRIFSGEDVVQRMCTQPNRGGNGFIKSPKDYIKIVSLQLLTGQL